MKFILVLLLLPAFLHAHGARFIKPGGNYTITFERSGATTATVLSDEGDGWFRVSVLGQSKELYMNVGLAAMVTPLSEDQVTEIKKKFVLDNLRQISAIAEQYLLEHPGVRVSVRDIKGYDRLLDVIVSFDGEDYRSLTYERGKPLKITTQTLGDVERKP